MSIRDKRLKMAINRILREELQKGNLPTSKEFVWRLNDYLQKQDITRPALDPKFVREGETAMAEAYNEAIDKTYEDFTALYAEIIDQHNKTMRNFSKFEVDKSKLDYELKLLENQLKELVLLYQGSGFLSSVFDVFADFSKVDQQKTTASVDIKNHEVRISDAKNLSTKIRANATARFELYDDIKQNVTFEQVSGVPDSALAQSANSTWQVQLLTDSKMPVGGYFYVTFANVQKMNRIVLSLHTVKPTFTRIEITPDNVNWIPLPYYEKGVVISKDFTFDFPEIQVGQIRVALAKTESDAQVTRTKTKTSASTGSGTGQIQPLASTFHAPPMKPPGFPEAYWSGYWNSKNMNSGIVPPKLQEQKTVTETNTYGAQMFSYVFGIKNISFYAMGYSDGAKFQSTSLQVAPTDAAQAFTIDKVSLSVEQEIPNGTNIRYSIATPPADPAGEPEWKPISPVEDQTPQFDQMIDFKNISSSTPTVLSVDPLISIGEYEVSNLYANGIKFYKIGEIKNRIPIDGTEKLYVGKNTWKVRSFAGKYDDHDKHLPNMEDWTAPLTTAATTYTKIKDGRPGLVLSAVKADGYGTSDVVPKSYMLTLGVYSKQANQVVTATPAANDPIAIYMNGSLLFQGLPDASTRVNYLFTSGWNEIVVLAYTGKTVTYSNGAALASASGITVDLNIDPRAYGSSVYAKSKELQKIQIFDLRYNTRMDDDTKYSIIQSNDKYQIILNNVTPGLDYEFYYNYVDGEVRDKIMFKAELTKDGSVTNLSPKLKAYRLRFS